MFSRRILAVALVVHLFCFGKVVTCAASSASRSLNPSLSVELSFSAKERFPLKSIKLSIGAPDGSTTWQYGAEDEQETDGLMKQRTLLAEDWFTTPGKYSLRVSYSVEGSGARVSQVEQVFLATGHELRLTAGLWFMNDQERSQVFLAGLTVRRFLPGPSSVWLIQDWIPAKETKPRYLIVNSSDQEIYGVGWQNNFFGSIQSEVNGQWIKYVRGGFCGTVSGGEPIKPNESAGSVEGYFIGRVNPFVNGRYRYVVQYSHSSIMEGLTTDLLEKGLTRNRVKDIYEVSAEFYIESNEP